MPGYADQRWNGITTLHFARLCAGLVRADEPPHGVLHVVPADVVTKAELLALLAKPHGRGVLEVARGPSPGPADRSLRTCAPELNRALWRAAAYDEPPTIATMVTEVARFAQ